MLNESNRVCVHRENGFKILDPSSVTCMVVRNEAVELSYDDNERSLYFHLEFFKNINSNIEREFGEKVITVCLLGLYEYPERVFQNLGEFKQLKHLIDLVPYELMVANEDHVREVNQFLEALFNRPELGYETK